MTKTLIALISTTLLTACATTSAKVYDEPMVLDNGTVAMLEWLNQNGYKDSLVTGRRLEDCGSAVAGDGVLLKRFEKSGKSSVASAVVCEISPGQYEVTMDMVE